MKPVSEASAAADIERLIVEMRPKLHRYCVRMVGSPGGTTIHAVLGQIGNGSEISLKLF